MAASNAPEENPTPYVHPEQTIHRLVKNNRFSRLACYFEGLNDSDLTWDRYDLLKDTESKDRPLMRAFLGSTEFKELERFLKEEYYRKNPDSSKR
jgi:hypothetical protein